MRLTRGVGTNAASRAKKYSGILPLALWASLRLFKIALGDFVERLEHDIRGAIPVGCFQRITNIALRR